MSQRVCIVGAGAVGGHLAAKLSRAGHDVSLIARGPHLEAIRANGLHFTGKDSFTAKVAASGNAADLGPQDVVFVTAKAQHLTGLATHIPPLLKAGTPVVFALNGVPWWWFHRFGDRPWTPIERLDPGRLLERTVGLERVIGCVIYSSNTIDAPGRCRNVNPQRNRFILGEPDDSKSDRVKAVAALFKDTDLDTPVAENIRREVWQKLLTNISNSGVCCLTGGTVGQTMSDPACVAVARAINQEAVAIAASQGLVFKPGYGPEAVAATLASPVAGHKPSMLQDLEAGKPLELDAQFRTAQDFARAAGIATPTLDTVIALLGLRARLATA